MNGGITDGSTLAGLDNPKGPTILFCHPHLPGRYVLLAVSLGRQAKVSNWPGRSLFWFKRRFQPGQDEVCSVMGRDKGSKSTPDEIPLAPRRLERSANVAADIIKASRQSAPALNDLCHALVSSFGGYKHFAKEFHAVYSNRATPMMVKQRLLESVMRIMVLNAQQQGGSSDDLSMLSDEELQKVLSHRLEECVPDGPPQLPTPASPAPGPVGPAPPEAAP